MAWGPPGATSSITDATEAVESGVPRLRSAAVMPNCRAADVLADTLIAHGVDRVFCVPGESYLALLDALYDRPTVDLVVARHEGGAGLMAMADARCTGRPGVCAVSRGPGATNASLAIHSAEQDAAPLVAIVGQVPRADLGSGAFQEIDYRQMFGGIAKLVREVEDGADLAAAFADAYRVAISGTPGPVVLAVPEDVFDDRVTAAPLDREPLPVLEPTDEEVDRVGHILAGARRPLLIAGAGLDSAAGRDGLARAARRHGLPVALAYKRQDLFDNGDPLFAGYLGFKVPRQQIEGLCEADAILAVGTRLTEMTTQHYRLPRAVEPQQRLVHVYPDAARLGRMFKTDVAVAADPVLLLERLTARPPFVDSDDTRTAWVTRLHEYAARLAAYSPTPRPDGVEFGAVVQAIARHANRDAVVSVDGGNFGGWVHRIWPWHPANRLVGTASGAMGMGVPGAVAAALRYPGRQVIAFAGDGGFMMTGNELATAVHRRLKLMVVVANNHSYGTIRQQQQLAYPGRAIGSDLGDVDFAKIAEACGARGFHVRALEDIETVVRSALGTDGVTLVDVETSLEAISAYRT
jgi:acetolactate synthase-1/2/3 large subunit